MLGTDEGPRLEMIEPLRDDSALKRFMDLRQGNAYPGGEGACSWVGMQVADLEAAVKRKQAWRAPAGAGRAEFLASAVELEGVILRSLSEGAGADKLDYFLR
jgi:hypothetical protein